MYWLTFKVRLLGWLVIRRLLGDKAVDVDVVVQRVRIWGCSVGFLLARSVHPSVFAVYHL